jgi:hypothetical protein
LQNNKYLKVLILSKVNNLTEQTLVNIGKYLPKLEGLDLSENTNIKGEFINLKYCPLLKNLILKGIKLRDNDLNFLNYLSNLTTLSIASKINIFKYI